MRIGLSFVSAMALGLALASVRAQTNEPAGLTNVQDRVGYAIGMNIGESLKQQHFNINLDELINGMKDALAGRPLKLTALEAHTAIMSYQQQRMQTLDAENVKAGEAFLAENAKKPGVKTLTVPLPGGKTGEMQYKILKEGTGETPGSNDTVTVNYEGTLLNGTVFDSSYKRGQPAHFMVGRVIPGWTAALEHMKVGSQWELYIPADLAYDGRGMGAIEPGSTLIFKVDLMGIDHPQPITSDIIRVPSAAEMKKGAKIEVIKPQDVQKEMAQHPGQNGATNK